MTRKKQLNDLVCYSHLRWEFVYQRPQHLMSRFARDRRVFFIEEHECGDIRAPKMKTRVSDGVRVVTPLSPRDVGERRATSAASQLVEQFFADQKIGDHLAWFY